MNVSHFSHIPNVDNQFLFGAFAIRTPFDPKRVARPITLVTQHAYAMVLKPTIVNQFVFIRFTPYTYRCHTRNFFLLLMILILIS